VIVEGGESENSWYWWIWPRDEKRCSDRNALSAAVEDGEGDLQQMSWGE